MIQSCSTSISQISWIKRPISNQNDRTTSSTMSSLQVRITLPSTINCLVTRLAPKIKIRSCRLHRKQSCGGPQTRARRRHQEHLMEDRVLPTLTCIRLKELRYSLQEVSWTRGLRWSWVRESNLKLLKSHWSLQQLRLKRQLLPHKIKSPRSRYLLHSLITVQAKTLARWSHNAVQSSPKKVGQWQPQYLQGDLRGIGQRPQVKYLRT